MKNYRYDLIKKLADIYYDEYFTMEHRFRAFVIAHDSLKKDTFVCYDPAIHTLKKNKKDLLKMLHEDIKNWTFSDDFFNDEVKPAIEELDNGYSTNEVLFIRYSTDYTILNRITFSCDLDRLLRESIEDFEEAMED